MAAIYGFGGLRTIEDHQALLESIVIETLALENTIARNRVLTQMLATGASLLKAGEVEERLAALEAAIGQRGPSGDDDPIGLP